MRRAMPFLLCCGLIMCSACNKAEPPPTESPNSTVSETKTTESEKESSSTIDKCITAEKEKATPVGSKDAEMSSAVVIKEEPQKTVKIKEINEPAEEIKTAPQRRNCRASDS